MVRHAAHQSVERIDLAHQMALAETADGRIAGHLADRGEAVRDQNRLGTESSRGRRGFRAGVPAPHDNDICSHHGFTWNNLNGFMPAALTNGFT